MSFSQRMKGDRGLSLSQRMKQQNCGPSLSQRMKQEESAPSLSQRMKGGHPSLSQASNDGGARISSAAPAVQLNAISDELTQLLAKIDAEKAMHQKAKEASQGFGDASMAIYALNMMTGTSLCPFCNQQVMLSTKCRARVGEYHMDLIKQKDDEEEEEDED